MKRYSLFFCLLFFFASCAVNTKNYNPSKRYSRPQLQQDYTLLKNILQQKHPALYWYTPKDSMDMFFAQYYNAIEDSMTEQQFGWKIIAPLTHHIHCGHTSFGMSKAYNKWVNNKRLPSFPLFFKVWNDTMVVTANLNRKDSILKRGTFVTGIDGNTNVEIIHRLFNYMTEDGYANNVNYLRLSNNFPYFHRNIYGLKKSYQINFIDSTGKPKQTTVSLFDPPKDTSKKTSITQLVKKDKKLTKQPSILLLRSLVVDTINNTAIITLNTFSNGHLRKFFRQTFRYIRKAQINNVVLDIRSNGGGKINASTLLTKYLSRKPFKVADTAYTVSKYLGPYTKYIKGKIFNNLGLFFFTKKHADGNFHFGYWEKKLFKPKTKNHFGGNLYVLTNGQTFSASSLFCNAVKGQQGVTLVGEETGGGWYGNSGIMIPDITLPITKLRVRLPLFKLVQYNHVPKTGTGVIPDILVTTSYDALIKSYDKKLQVVMELIKEK